MNIGRQVPGEFAFGERLGERIREVAAGQNVCCAIAFWSEDGVAEIFPSGITADAKIVCDISMGATSANALLALGGPRNECLRHQLGMHAKVCLSNRGLVVSSANASHAAIGSSDRPGHHLEAGTFHASDSGAWHEATAWFEGLFSRARPIGPNEITWANSVYRPPLVTSRQRPPRRGSLLDLIIAVPERFEAIGFVFVGKSNTKEAIAEVREHATNLDPERSSGIKSLSSGGVFSGWGERQTTHWPSRFVEFWQPNEQLFVFGRRLEVRIPKIGSIMSVTDWRGLKNAVGMELPPIREIGKIDAKLALLVRGGKSGVLFTSGTRLARRLGELEPQH
jgi:hypothetical protein